MISAFKPTEIKNTASPASEDTSPDMTLDNKEAVVLMDDDTWLWELTQKALSRSGVKFIKTPSNLTIRQSWSRFHDTPFMIIHWENKHRQGGALIEEILEIDQRYDAANKLIVVTTNPIHEDVVYFSELGIRANYPGPSS